MSVDMRPPCSDGGIPQDELEEVMEAYDQFIRARQKAFDRTPHGDQILCLTQHTAKLPAHYPNYEEAKTAFKALKTLRRRIAAVISFVANTTEVRTALEEANHDDVVCKRVLENKCGFDFLAIAKATYTPFLQQQ